MNNRLCLIVVDGFGVAPEGPGNARTLANLPTIKRLEAEVPSVLMDASGEAVGLPVGQQGASEPGHLTIGAGRVVFQPLAEIDRAIRMGDFEKNPVLAGACERAAERKVPLHLFGLYSKGGVHSSAEHYHAMLRLAKAKGVERVFLHLFGDGRDVGEQQFSADFELLEKEIDEQKIGAVASVIGRYYAMDRDKQYARTKLAYDLMTQGIGEETPDVLGSVRNWYVKAPDGQKTDYYLEPLKTPAFQAIGENDVAVCVNFRSDRSVQIVEALEAADFQHFPRPVRVKDVVCVGPYSQHLPVAFPPADVTNTLGQVVSDAGKKQLRVAETDKFAHATFFFNAQRQEPYANEDRVLVESPKVPNYAETPEMSASKLTDEVLARVRAQTYDLIVMNYANCDLVGHGGKIEAVVKSCESVDRELARLLPELEANGYQVIITADHGNCEEMLVPGTQTISPSHSCNQVQTFVIAPDVIKSSDDLKGLTGLKDIAPLSLKLMGLPVPPEMQ